MSREDWCPPCGGYHNQPCEIPDLRAQLHDAKARAAELLREIERRDTETIPALDAQLTEARARAAALGEVVEGSIRVNGDLDRERSALLQERDALKQRCNHDIGRSGGGTHPCDCGTTTALKAIDAALQTSAEVAKSVDAPPSKVVPGSLPGVAGSSPALCTRCGGTGLAPRSVYAADWCQACNGSGHASPGPAPEGGG